MRNTAMKTALKRAMTPAPSPRYTKPANKREPFRKRTPPPKVKLPAPIPMEAVLSALAAHQEEHGVVLADQPEAAEQLQDVLASITPEVIDDLDDAMSEVPVERPSTPIEMPTVVALGLQPPASPSPDLSWLNKNTPVTETLKVMIGPARDRKTTIAFEMECLRKQHVTVGQQIEALEAQRLDLELRMEKKREAVRQIDELVSACGLVADQASQIADLLVRKPTVVTGNGGSRQRMPSELTYSATDCYQYFVDHPDETVGRETLVAAAPPEKAHSAKLYTPQRLHQLYTQGKLSRVGNGMYTLAKVH